jgi:5'-nucleotidase / UDP-sugar diphosphatase
MTEFQRKKDKDISKGEVVRKRLIVTFFVVVAMQMIAACVLASERLTILHVNDFHGRIFPYVDKTVDPVKPSGGAAYLASMVAEQREQNSGGVILVAAGDMFQGTPVSNIFRGKPILEMMNKLRFDAMTLGNHEFDWGRTALADLVAQARFPFISANIKDAKGLYLRGIEPYIMIERKGVKVAIIGLATPETAYTTKPDNVAGLTFLDPIIILPEVIHEVRQKGARLVVLLTHLGLDDDKKVAAAVPGIDVIVGGHTHTVVTDPVVVGRTIITQAGYNGLYLGVLELTVDEKTGFILGATKKGELRRVSAGPDDRFDPEIKKMADSYSSAIKSKFEQVVAETAVNLTRQSDGESILGDVITDAMKAASGADIAIQNSGGIRAEIPAGKITMEQVYTVLPFDNELIAMDLQGSDIIALFERVVKQRKDMLQVSGIKVVYAMESKDAEVSEAMINGQPVDRNKVYRVATNDFLSAAGDDFKEFLKGRNIVFMGALRDIFVNYIKANSPVSAPKDGRLIIRSK